MSDRQQCVGPGGHKFPLSKYQDALKQFLNRDCPKKDDKFLGGHFFWHRSLLSPLYPFPYPIMDSPPLTLERCEVRGANPLLSWKSAFNFWFPWNLVFPQYPHRGLVPGGPTDPKSADAWVPCRKWWRTMHRVGSSHPQMPNHGSKIVQVFIEKKNPCISGPAEF